MTSVGRAAVEAVLRTIVDPCSIATGVPIDLVDMGLLMSVDAIDGDVVVTLCLTSPTCWQAANIIAEVERKVSALPDVRRARCVIAQAAAWMPDMMSAAARQRLRQLRPIEDEKSS